MVILEVWGNKFPRVDKIWAKGRHCPPCPPPPNDATGAAPGVYGWGGKVLAKGGQCPPCPPPPK